MHRLFVALRPPPAIRQRLLDLMVGVPGARWQDEEQLHLTLAFLGEVERPVAEELAARLGRIRHPPVMAALRGVGTFERRGRPHSLWVGCAADDALTRLHQRVRHAALLAGLRPDNRAFLPHVTIARLGAGAGPVEPFVAKQAGIALPPFSVDAFLLFESHLGHNGASYEAVARYPLAMLDGG